MKVSFDFYFIFACHWAKTHVEEIFLIFEHFEHNLDVQNKLFISKGNII